MKQYPGFVEAFRRRHTAYMEAVDFINNPPEGVVIHEITPDSLVAVSRTSRDRKALRAAYHAGVKEGRKFFENGNRGMPALQHAVIPGR